MSEDKMREGIDVFNELLDLSKTCHEDIKRAVENTLKIGTNIGGDPVIFSAMISEMFLKEAVSFATSVQRSAVNQYTKERKKAILAHLGMND